MLATLYTETGKYEEAMLLFQKALAIREKYLHPEHLDVAKTLTKFARFYWKLKKFDDAINLLERA